MTHAAVDYLEESVLGTGTGYFVQSASDIEFV